MITKQKEKKITIDRLAIMIAEGFAAVAKDISFLAGRMNKFEESVNVRFDEVDKRFGKVDQRFDVIDRRFDDADKRIGGISLELKEIRKEIKVNELKTRGDAANLDFRVGKLEKNAGI